MVKLYSVDGWVCLFACAQVEFSVENSTFHLLVDGIRVTDGRLPNNEGSSLDLHNPVYLGAGTKSKNTKVCIRLKLWQIFSHIFLFAHWPASLFSSCPLSGTQHPHRQCYQLYKGIQNEWCICWCSWGEPQSLTVLSWACRGRDILWWRSHRLRFGLVFQKSWCCWCVSIIRTLIKNISILDNYFTVGSHFLLSFKLRPQHLTGLLFHIQSDKTSLNVFLMENKVKPLALVTTNWAAIQKKSCMRWQNMLCFTRWASKQMMVMELLVSQ